jgi:hypothetical protein
MMSDPSASKRVLLWGWEDAWVDVTMPGGWGPRGHRGYGKRHPLGVRDKVMNCQARDRMRRGTGHSLEMEDGTGQGPGAG